MRRIPLVCLVVALVWIAYPLRGHDTARAMSEAASSFLAGLTDAQRARGLFPLPDAERENWHFVPRSRKGIPLKEMSDPQRQRAHALLAAGLSQRGHVTASAIIELEKVLRVLEGDHRDAGLYFFTIFGEPAPAGTWGWRVEGHHLSINFTIVEGRHVAATPSFFGANPAHVRSGERSGQRVLAEEEDLARQLVLSLDDAQRKLAVISERAPRDIVTGADRQAKLGKPEGLPVSQMNGTQKEALLELLKLYVYRHRELVAAKDMEKIVAAGLDRVHFAWAGGLAKGEGHYYRIHGPTFVVEYDNTQNRANHIHTVWRDFEGDFGRDVLREHYERDHPKS